MEIGKRKSNTIVLIHGLFLNSTSWSEWKTYFESKGYKVYTPSYPGHDKNSATLRAYVDQELTRTGFMDVVNKTIQFVDSLPERPIVIGHSMGYKDKSSIVDFKMFEGRGHFICGEPK